MSRRFFVVLTAVSLMAGPAAVRAEPAGRAQVSKTMDAAIAAQTPAANALAQCVVCHTVKKGEPAATGPNLFGIYGDKIASRPGFRYSGALKKRGGSWTEEELDVFLTSPQAYAPGTPMAFSGSKNAERRRQWIEALKSLR